MIRIVPTNKSPSTFWGRRTLLLLEKALDEALIRKIEDVSTAAAIFTEQIKRNAKLQFVGVGEMKKLTVLPRLLSKPP